MAYLIDTYNCVHAGRAMGGPFTDLTVGKLCAWIAASAKNVKATLVLDGRKKPDEPDDSEFTGIRFVYSGTGIKADLVIAQTVELAQNRKKITVVSNDRAVVLHARRNFAGAMSCEAFLAELLNAQPGRAGKRAVLPPQKTAGTSSSGETEHWLKEFGITPPPPPKSPTIDDDDDEFGGIDMDKLVD